MKAKSCYSQNLDAYRAGIEISEQLLELKPEVIFIFPTIHYKGSKEFCEGIYDVLNNDKLIIIGNTGDGFYEKNKVAGVGVSALGINSFGKIKWSIVCETGVKEDPQLAIEKCSQKFKERSFNPSLCIISSDFRIDGSELVSSLNKNFSCPFVGGLASDDYLMESCFVYKNREVLTNSIVILGLQGEFFFDIFLAHNLVSIGRTGRITGCSGTSINTINSIPATEFLTNELGKPLETIDEGILTFKITEHKNPSVYRIHSLLIPKNENHSNKIDLYGGLKENEIVQIAFALPEKIIEDIQITGNMVNNILFEPELALVVSCAGRKQVLGCDVTKEVEEIINMCPQINALAGYTSMGEIAPLKINDKFSDVIFHNMTYVILVMGLKIK